MKRPAWVRSVTIAVCMGLSLVAATPDARAAVQPPSNAWSRLVDEYLESFFRAHPHFAASVGRHEYDGLLPDWSATGIRAEVRRLKAFRRRVAAFPDAKLDAAARFEREYLLTRIDREIYWRDVAEAPFRNPAFYLGFGDGGDSLDPSTYVVRPYGPPEQRVRAFITYARSVARAAPQIRSNLRLPLPATYVKLGSAGFAGLADFYRHDVPQAFAEVRDPALQAELAAAIEPAARALDALAAWLKSEGAHATDVQPLGADRYAAMLHMTERVDLPIADIEAAGRADLARNLAALREACASYAPGVELHDCVGRVEAQKPANGPVAEAREQLVVLRRFVADHDLLTIPGTEEAQVQEAPPFNRQNGAYCDTPGPYEKQLPSVYYIAPPDPTWTPAEQAAYIKGRKLLLFTSAHEVWPGHFLQFQWANRAPSKLASLFVGYAYAEGWAHYAEEMLWEKGLGAGDPETHIGQLIGALVRDVRLLSSIGLHTGGMTVVESERMFREQAFVDPGTARQQAARGTYDPGYLSYTLGKLMIRKLRADYCATRGGESCWKEFHDHFLAFGGPPIPLLRRAMLPDDRGPIL